MKMKKIVLLFSMIAVFFSLTGCSDGQEEVTFDYTNTDVIDSALYQAYQLRGVDDANRAYLEDSAAEMEEAQILLTGISNFDSAKEDCGEFKGYRSKEDGSTINFDYASLSMATDQESYDEANAARSLFLSLVDAAVEEKADTVVVTLTAVYNDRDVEYSFVYEENPAYAYSYALSGQNVSAYKVKEINAAPNYTFREQMAKAGSNTLIGMGTVFVVLIFISLIIAQLEKIAKAITNCSNKVSAWWHGRKEKKKETDAGTEEQHVSDQTTPGTAVTAASNPMEDTELVAVITAAVVAASVASGGSDKLIVRSIKKAKR